MKSEKIICDHSNLKKIVLPKLIGTIFHVTSEHAFQGILANKNISPNQDEKFTFSFSQSKNSFGKNRNYVCLFDLRTKEQSVIDETLDRFYFLNPGQWDTSVFLSLDESACSNLIPNHIAREEIGYKEVWIPNTEVWYPEAIPLNRIVAVLEVRIVNRHPSDIFIFGDVGCDVESLRGDAANAGVVKTKSVIIA